MQGTLEANKSKEMDSLEPPKGASPINTLILAP